MERTDTSRSSPDAPARRVAARRHRWWRRWPEWIGYAAAAWSLAYAVAGLHWARGGAGFPFGALHDPAAHLSVLGGARREIAAPAIAILGLIGAAVAVAVAVPLLYAATRWTWALGAPLGITEELYRDGRAVGLWWIGAALATLAAAGSLLTLGLVGRWGEIFPRRLPAIGGRRVPPALAIVPAALVSVVVTSAGLMFVRLGAAGTLAIGGHTISFDENFGALAPELLWPVWGAALGAATLAYYYRRREGCIHCGRS